MCIDTISGNLDVREVGNASAVSHLVFSIANIHFKDPGLVNFVLFIDDKEINSIPLYVRQGK